MSKPILYYFNGRGKAETTRYMFKIAGVDFEDKRIEGDWKENWKHLMPFGAMPVLEIDGVKYCQSSAIERYVAKKYGFMPAGELDQMYADGIAACGDDILNGIMKARNSSETEEGKKEAIAKFASEQLKEMLGYLEKMVKGDTSFLAGNKLTWPDIAISHLFSFFPVMAMEVDFTAYPKLDAIRKSFESNEVVKKWMGERPQSTF